MSKKDIGNAIAIWAAVFLIAVVLGGVTALAPMYGAIIAIPAFFAILGIFSLTQGDHGPLKETTVRWLITTQIAITLFWPTYLNLHIGSLPVINPRRLWGLLVVCLVMYAFIGRATIRKQIWDLSFLGKLTIGLALALLTLRFFSALSSPYLVSGLTAFIWEVAIFFSVFFLAVIFADKEAAYSFTTKLVLVAAVICSLMALSEAASGRNFVADFLMPFSGDAEMLTAMLQSRVRDGALRAQGPFEHPLLLAEFGSMGCMFGLAVLLWGKSARERWFGFFGILSAIVCVVLSYSRSAVVCVAVGGAWIVALWILKPKKATTQASAIFRIVGLATTLLVAAVLLVQVAQTLAVGKSQAESESTAARTIMLQKGIALVREKPLMGWGVGTGVELAGIKGRGGVPTLDNYLLMIAVESGAPYMLLFCLFILTPVAIGGYSVLRGTTNSPFIAAASAALLSFLVMRSVLGITYNIPLAFLLAGLILPMASFPAKRVTN